MKKRALFILISLFCTMFLFGEFLKLSASPQEDPRIKFIKMIHGGSAELDNNEVKIPFVIKGPHIILIKARINGNKSKECFVFDTSGQTIFDKSLIKKYKLNSKEIKPGSGVYIAKLKEIKLKGINIKGYTPFFTNFKKKYGALGKTADLNISGMISGDLFRSFKLTIDYQNRFIILSDTKNELKEIKPNRKLMEMTILFPYHPSVKVNINDEKILNARIDTGFMYAVGMPISMIDKLLTEKERNNLIKSKGVFAKWPEAKKKFNYLYEFKKIKIGKIILKDQPVIFGELPRALGKEYILLGKNFLENYKTTIDFKERKVLFSKVKDNNKSLSYSIGANIAKEGNKTFVKGIWENSPADKKGVEVGDIVLSINGIPTKNLYNTAIFNYLLDKSEKKLKLKIKKKGGRIISLILIKK